MKTREILNKIFFSTKKYLIKLKLEQNIENNSQENLFSLIEKSLDNSPKKGNFSNDSITFNSNSYDYNNFLFNQKYINDLDFKSFYSDDLGKTLKILNKESCTPKFSLISDNENEEKKKIVKIYV